MTTQTARFANRVEPVLLSDRRIVAIPVLDNHEPLVDLHKHGISCEDDRADGVPASRLVRTGVATRLEIAQQALPRGLRLHVVEAFRTASAQQAIIDAYSQVLRTSLASVHPDEILRLSSRFVAPLAVAPHTAGAAVDLTLVDSHGAAVDMGTPVDATPEQSDGACFFDAPNISAPAREHRALLAAAMQTGGLVNYPTEWWHWSYGDRYWAFTVGARHATFGRIENRPVRRGPIRRLLATAR